MASEMGLMINQNETKFIHLPLPKPEYYSIQTAAPPSLFCCTLKLIIYKINNGFYLAQTGSPLMAPWFLKIV